MGESTRSFNPFNLWLRAMGSLVDAGSAQGRAFKMWEERMTELAGRLSQNELFLNQMGKMLERNFQARAGAQQLFEQNLHAMRMPSLGDLQDLQIQMRQLDDKIEALGARLDTLMDLVEKQAGEGGQVIRMESRRPRSPSAAPRSTRKSG